MPDRKHRTTPNELTQQIHGEAATLGRMDVTQPVILTRELSAILDNPTASNWIKAAIMRLCKDRDPIDAINDVEVLHQLMTKWYELFTPPTVRPQTTTILVTDLEDALRSLNSPITPDVTKLEELRCFVTGAIAGAKS